MAKRRRRGGVINAAGGERIAEQALGSRVTDGSKRSVASDGRMQLFMLDSVDLKVRLSKPTELVDRHLHSIHVAEKITQKVAGQLSKSQKEFLLRQQRRWIQTDLQELELDEAQHPKERADGWMEVKLGSFSVKGKNMRSYGLYGD
ncbi:hypothetical protein M0R45_003627 [Rubus argutus]|uniref:Uncharacterized protein n=1 Tax=Rubus argutus TaxID=59490 RepID=A0AAW1YFZ7_RUBAR